MADELNTIRAHVKQLFEVSDEETKGFIVKRDMQRMRSEVPLSPEQLEAVFDMLDTSNSGYLTIQQFLDGFGNFLSNNQASSSPHQDSRSTPDSSDIYTETSSSYDTCDDQFSHLIEQLSETRMLDTTDVIRQLCDDVIQDGGHRMQVDLEMFLGQLVVDLRRQQGQQNKMEAAMKIREETHNTQVRKLFEEMESHLKEEKEKVMIKVEQCMRNVRRQLETEVAQKREELKEVTSQKHKVAFKLQLTKASEATLRRSCGKLLEEKQDLASTCERQVLEIQQLRRRMAETQMRDSQKHVASGFRLAQRIIVEEQGLLQQLKQLKTIAHTLEGGDKTTTSVHHRCLPNNLAVSGALYSQTTD